MIPKSAIPGGKYLTTVDCAGDSEKRPPSPPLLEANTLPLLTLPEIARSDPQVPSFSRGITYDWATEVAAVTQRHVQVQTL